MRKRFTADIELSAPDMKAFLEIVAANSVTFTMHDVGADEPKPPRHNSHHRTHMIEFPKMMQIHVTSKRSEHLPEYQRKVLELLRTRYGAKPFRKGEGSAVAMREQGHGASSAITMLCRHGYLAAP